MSSNTPNLGLLKADLPDSVDVIADIANNLDKIDAAISPIGVIIAWPVAAVPAKYLLCDGSAVNRVTYAKLFALIGTTYGVGDGATTFNLPNMKGAVPVGYDVAQVEFNTIGKTGGEKTHTTTVAEMPAHGHQERSGAGGAAGQTHAVIGTTFSSSALYGNNPETEVVGGGGAHNNLQPYIALNFIIKALY